MDITPVLQPVLLLVLTALATSATAYVIKLIESQKARVSKEHWSLFTWIVSQAVWAVEQKSVAGLIEKHLKLSEAIKIVQYQVDFYGLRGINVQQITDACIAAVGSELNKSKLLEPRQVADLPTGPQN